MTSDNLHTETGVDAFGVSDARSRRLLIGMILIYALVGACLGYYRCWYIYRSSIDSAMLSQVLWATAKGYGVLYSPIWAENFLAENFCPLVLVLVPIFWILPAGKVAFGALLFCQSLAIGACALPAYGIARRRINDNTACLILAAVTILYPTVLTQNFFQFIPHILGLPFILAALYYYEVGAFRRFLLCCVLAIAGKETFAMGIFLFGPIALFQRRDWRWVAFPLLFSPVFLLIYFKLIAPYFRGDGGMHSGIYLSYLGDSFGEIARRVVTDPGVLAEEVFRPRKLMYPFHLWAPAGLFLPLLGWPALLCIPDFLINMVSSSESFTVIRHHYGTVIGVFLCAASIHAIGRLSARISEKWKGKRNALFLSLALLVVCISGWSPGFALPDWDPLPNRGTLTRAISMIPPDASVACSEDLAVHLIYRRNACDNTMLKWRFGEGRLGEDRRFEALTQFDYIVFNVAPVFFYSQQLIDWSYRLMKHPDYITLLNDDATIVFERRTKGKMDDFWKQNPEF